VAFTVILRRFIVGLRLGHDYVSVILRCGLVYLVSGGVLNSET